MAITLTIAGTVRPLKRQSLHVSMSVKSRWTLRANIVSIDGSYRPAIDQEVVLADGANTLFKGTINKLHEHGLGGMPKTARGNSIETTIYAADYSSIADRRYPFARLNATTAQGTIRLDDNVLRPVGTTTLHMDGARALPSMYDTFTIAGDPVEQTVVAVVADGDPLTSPDYQQFFVTFTPGISVQIPAVDGNELVTFKTGYTTKELATFLVNNYLAPFGVTLGAGMADGITQSAIWDGSRNVTAILNELAQNAAAGGWLWRIDETKVLRFYVPGGLAAPISITDATPNCEGDLTIEPDRTQYANNVLVRAGGVAPFDVVNEQQNGDGVKRVFPLVYPNVTVTSWASESGHPRGLTVVRSGPTYAAFSVGLYGIHDMPWTYDWFRHALIQRTDQTVVGASDYIDYSYQAIGFHVRVNDSAEEALYGTWETVIDVPKVYDDAVATSIGNAELSWRKTTPKRAVFRTRDTGMRPNQSLTINLTPRNVNASFLVMEVDISDDGSATGPVGHTPLLFECSAIQGTVVKRNEWRDTYIKWGESKTGNVGVGPVSAADIIVATTGGGGAGGSGRVYPLHGTTAVGVQSPTPTWVTIGSPARLNSANITGPVTVVAYVRADDAGRTVTARLWNLTDGSQAGIGTAKTGTTFQIDAFSATLATGTKDYVLQLLPGTTNADVWGTAYLET